jgi:hypothetical protein
LKFAKYKYLDLQPTTLFAGGEVIREEFRTRMDIKKELDEIKKSQETLKKIADLQEKQDKKMAKRPHSGPYEMM